MKRIKMKVYYNIVHVSEYIENYEYFFLIGASLVTQMVKNLPAMKETWVQSLGQEDPPGEWNGNQGILSILAWRIPWTEEPGRIQPMGSQSDMTEWLTLD